MSTRFGPKHQCRVNECYPQSAGQIGAVPSKVSALVYYINARPGKMLKVSAYIERKIQRDIVRESSDYNCVTIDIVIGIMRGCTEYFSTFAPTVLQVLKCFSCKDLALQRTEALINRITSLYIEFCRYAKPVLASIRDGEFFELLTEVLNLVLNLHYGADQRAMSSLAMASVLLAAASMEDFCGPKGDLRMVSIVHAIVDEFYNKNLDVTKLIPENLVSRNPAQRKVGAELPEVQIAAAFVNFIENTNSTTVPAAISSIFAEFDRIGWIHQKFCFVLLQLLVLAVPAPYLCVVLSEFFKRLERTSQDSVVIILSDCIAEVLLSNRSPLGYSAIELASNFLRLLRKLRPNACQDPRVSFTDAAVPPPRTIYSVCNAFVSLLQNANFALQRFEVIEHIITKAYFPKDAFPLLDNSSTALLSSLSCGPRFLGDAQNRTERHTMGTIVLNTTEERHLQSVVWGVLNALAEEALPPSALRLTFSEIHTGLFEKLFQLSLSADPEVCLNSLVLWRRLLDHGLFMSPPRRSTNLKSALSGKVKSHQSDSESYPTIAAQTSSSPQQSSAAFSNKISMYLMAKSRAVIAAVVNTHSSSVLHYAAVYSLLEALAKECDHGQFAVLVSESLWLHELSTTNSRLTFEDRACVAMFLCVFLQTASRIMSCTSLEELANSSITKLNAHGMRTITTNDALIAGWKGPDFERYEEFVPANIVPSFADVSEVFESGALGKIALVHYDPSQDAASLPGLQPVVEHAAFVFTQAHDAIAAGHRQNRVSGALLHRLSRTASGSFAGGPVSYRSLAPSEVSAHDQFTRKSFPQTVDLVADRNFTNAAPSPPACASQGMSLCTASDAGANGNTVLSSVPNDGDWQLKLASNASQDASLGITASAPPDDMDSTTCFDFATRSTSKFAPAAASQSILSASTPGFVVESVATQQATSPFSNTAPISRQEMLDVHFDELTNRLREQRQRRENHLSFIFRSPSNISSSSAVDSEVSNA